MIAFLLNPLGRYIMIGGVVIAVIFGAYYKVRSDAIREAAQKAQEDVMRRTKDALDRGNAVDTRPERLRDNDGHRRD
jgi:hypothetical protein